MEINKWLCPRMTPYTQFPFNYNFLFASNFDTIYLFKI